MAQSPAEDTPNGAGPLMRRLTLAYLRQEGAASVQAGRRSRAKSYLEAALALGEDDADLWTLLGAAASDTETRAICARRALSLDPGHRPAQSLLATVPPPARGIRSRLPSSWRQLPHAGDDNGDIRRSTYTALAQAYARTQVVSVAARGVPPALRNRLVAGLVLLVVLALNLLLGNAYAQKYRAAIYPGVRIGGLAVGGQDPAVAEDLLRQQLRPYLQQPFSLGDGTHSWSFSAAELGLCYRVAEATGQAWELGRRGSPLGAWFERLRLAVAGQEVPLLAELRVEPLQAAVDQVAAALDRPAVPPSVSWQEGVWAISPGQDGRHVARPELRQRLVAALTDVAGGADPAGAQVPWIAVPVVTDSAALAAHELAYLQIRLDSAGRPLTVCCAGQTWNLAPADIAPWLQVNLDPPAVGLNRAALSAYLAALAPQVELPVVPPRLEVVGDRAVDFQPGQDGRQLDVAAALTATEALLQRRLAGEPADTLDLPAVVIPAGNDAVMAQLGVIEPVGEGTSTFAGSSWQRATNIAIGGQELHGRLIAPDEVFSLNDALNPISADKGYQYSLIIGSGGVMYYGLGGGLCQVATTLYRAALYSGLEIVERTPHLWRIEYYEQDAQAGFDATIYAGSPDLKFCNNTGHYLLLQVETDLDNARQTMRFYGTSPGWAVSIEDYWLSADGHSASYRRVVRKDGVVISEQTFYSYYQ